jgi:2'-5' RNA ligase
MVQSVELLLDEDAEEAVLAQWRLLAEAGLASQARHRSPSNRPHLTLAAVPALEEPTEVRVAGLLRDALPLEAYVGPLGVFGRDPVVLVRLVVAGPVLRELQAAVAGAVGVPDDSLGAAARWVPHVTLAHRMPLEQLSRAVGLLPRGEGPVRLGSARRWDSDAGRTWSPV